MKSELKSVSIFLILMICSCILLINASSTQTSNKSSTNDKSTGQLNSKIKSNISLNSKILGTLNSKFKISGLNKAPEEKNQAEPIIDLNPNTGKEAIWKGWVKYFYFKTDRKFSEPRDFFVNNYFYKQKVVKDKLLEKSALPGEENIPENKMFVNIPSKFHFYATLNNNYLQIKGDRLNTLTSHIESLNLDLIDPPHKTDMEKTGVKELGKFDEGFCFDLSVHDLKRYEKDFIPTVGEFSKSEPTHWILCLEDESQYIKLISLITTLIDEREKTRNRGDSENGNIVKEEEVNEERYEGPDANPTLDGYLVKINDWTGCTLKCGGGFSFQQWRCVPPKEGGKPCMGELVRKKPCNTQPCPGISFSKNTTVAGTANNKEESVVAEPIIKSSFVSNRPQQNVDGVIRDEDVLQEYIDSEKRKISLPARLIMNKSSVTCYTDIETHKNIFAWDLTKTKLVPIKGQDCCFFLRNQNQEHKICGLSKCNDFVKSWGRTMDIFLAKTYEIKEVQPSDPNKANAPDPNSANKTGGLAMTMEMDESSAMAKSKVITDKLEKKFMMEKTDSVKDTQKDVLKAINREIDIEEMIRKEEMMRTQERIKNKMEEYKHEEKKKDKLEEALTKQQETQTSLVSDLKTKQNILEIKKEAELDVQARREALKKKIQKIRLLADRRTRIIQQKINIIRNKMTRTVVEAAKNGDQEICKKSSLKQELMNKYCDENLIDDYAKNAECKTSDNFCFSCCDNEFGQANVTGKEGCYSFCLEGEGLRGDWGAKPIKK